MVETPKELNWGRKLLDISSDRAVLQSAGVGEDGAAGAGRGDTVAGLPGGGEEDD